MKKYFLKVLVLTLSMIGIIFVPTFASDISEQIRNTKCITEYPVGTKYDDFDTVTFGEYPTNSEQDITANGEIAPIDWFILEKQENKAFLLSKYGLGTMHKNATRYVTSWKNSFLYNFLNQTFKNKAFNSDEQTSIMNINDNGYVFIPSYDELIKYFGINQQKSNEKYMYFNSEASYIKYYKRSYNKNIFEIYPSWGGSYCLRDVGYKDSIKKQEDKKFFWETKPTPYEQINYVFLSEPVHTGTDNGGKALYVQIRPAIWVSLSDNGNQNSRSTNNFTTQQNNAEKTQILSLDFHQFNQNIETMDIFI